MTLSAIYSVYGLRVWRANESSTSHQLFDVLWKHKAGPERPYDGTGLISQVDRCGAWWTRHTFAAGSTTHAEFDVSPDGHRVASWASPAVEPFNLQELFLETVMRTVLCRLGLPAVHAAALEKGGSAVLLMGAKGAGKSTLAAGLQANGWRLIADDLVRLRLDNQDWCALPGMQRSKLLPDSMNALGHSPETAERRWKGEMPPGVEAQSVAKFLLRAGDPVLSSASFPVMAVFCLTGRRQGMGDPSIVKLPTREAVILFSEHLIRDPLPPFAPPALAGTMMGDISSQGKVWRVELPDDLQRVQKSAAGIDAFLMTSLTATSELSKSR